MERFICYLLFFSFNYYACFQVNCLSSLASFSPNTSTHYLCPSKQSLALLQFKRTITVDSKPSSSCIDNSFPKIESWKEGSDCCSWDGVTCNEVTGSVIGLDLDCSWLQGTIEDDSSLFQLSNLQWLNLAYNDFSFSKISLEFGRLTELTRLNLSYSKFYGLVPPDISRLSKLTLLDLSAESVGYLRMDQQTFDLLALNITRLSVLKLLATDMSPVKPCSLLNLSCSMVVLDLSRTGIQGKFPEEIFQLPNLQEIYLTSSDDLTGYFPKSNWSSHLRVLDLRFSNFKGEISDSIGNNKFLEILSISGCSFVGLIPASIGNLTQLTQLKMDDNYLTGELPSLSKLQKVTFINFWGNKLTGPIPEIFDNFSVSSSRNPQLPYHVNVFSHLKEVDLSGNCLNGKVPSWLFTLPSLEYIYITSNKLTGPIEPFNLSLSNSLGLVDLRSNEIHGEVPSSLFTLPSLKYLYLSSNKLTGFTEAFNFSNSLQAVHLQNNEMHGKVPTWLFTLPSLVYLDLSRNKFTDPIEEFSLSMVTSLQGLFLQDNEVHGSVPSSIFKLENLTILDISSNKLSGTTKFDMLSKLKNLENLNLSNNSLLAFSSTSNMNYSLSNLTSLKFSFCNVRQFPMFLRTFEKLLTLDLSNNKIGQISKAESEGWKRLSHLNLSNNFLTYIENHPWKNINILDLRNNKIQGSILVPPPSTQVFLFSNNKLSGKIPPSICRLTSLRYLSLSENNLSGVIPSCLGNISSRLVMLHLQKNNLQGSIPHTFAKGSSLKSLDLNSNRFEGPLPRSLANCSQLEVVNVGKNMINDTFPCWLGALRNLKVLILRSNRFYGPICDSKAISPFDNLQILDLSGNEFTGFLPRRTFAHMEKLMDAHRNKFGGQYMGGSYYHDSINVTMKGGEFVLDRIFTIFTSIDLSRNRLQGEIPEVLGKFKSLVVLNLSHNSLTGNIPVSLANLTALESLDFSFNKLDGRIPDQLISVTTLSALNLSYNRLSGIIPQGNQFNTFENDSFIGNKGLCGKPLSVKCGNNVATTQPPSSSVFNGEDGILSGFDWKFAMMGYASGVVIGISMGYIIFSTGKPQWFVRMIEERLIKNVRRSSKKRGRANK